MKFRSGSMSVVETGPGQGHDVEALEQNAPGNHLVGNHLEALRGRATQAMDDLAFLRWRLGGIFALAVIAALIFFVSKQGDYVPSPAAVDAARVKTPATSV